MNIQYFEDIRIFKLDTQNCTYMFQRNENLNTLEHLYYGRYVPEKNLTQMLKNYDLRTRPRKPNPRERLWDLALRPMEYSTDGIGDFRESCLSVQSSMGHSACELEYRSYRIFRGKPVLEHLPATFGSEEECMTLEITCEDPLLHLQVVLVYSIFDNLDVVTRSQRISNLGTEPLFLQEALSSCLDLQNRDYEYISLHGFQGRERHIQRHLIAYGRQNMASTCGETSHVEHPFLAVLEKSANQERGEVFGFNLIYSGNFLAQIERNQTDDLRIVMGINPKNFRWKLNQQDTFTTPEAVMVYSHQGLDQMTHQFHNLYRNHLIRGVYKDKKRPVLINNWEATFFEFNTKKLLDIATEAAKSGIEMLVMDDGWFSNRDYDDRALGDWNVNEEKLPGGLSYLVEEVNKLGMKFGIWFEPEMVSRDSELYRKHPDFAIQIPGRLGTEQRNQLVLDYSRKDVRDYVYAMISDVLHSANIEYVKWDMNRYLTDVGSYAYVADQQGEIFHRYVLGVYEMQEHLMQEFPNLLLENCSAGGGRFDPGMLYYSPQIWCSDDTEAIERLLIQEGTAIVYPLSSIGAHVSKCPDHLFGRTTPFETRGYVALAGTFGYELDITQLTKQDREMIPQQIEMYHKYNELIRTGDYYRLSSYSQNQQNDCWMVVSSDQQEALVTFVQVFFKTWCFQKPIRLRGLIPEATYLIEETGEQLSGAALMYAGYTPVVEPHDYMGCLIHLTAI